MTLWTVKADRETGEWLPDTLTAVGTVSRSEWNKMRDTAILHYDTFERDGETCAVEVTWV